MTHLPRPGGDELRPYKRLGDHGDDGPQERQ